ncbi:MAG: aldehyde:ferredoxin oxidoreductase [Moorella sp. (in: firmicutes)]|nr:aldehyde:ferredoxin oxidoreductase [Moorella sp. (in: firmicutes)]
MHDPTGGYAGKALFVDLNSEKIEVMESKIEPKVIGGRGFGSWYLLMHTKAGQDPLSPENPLVFSTGPLTGTIAPASSRLNISNINVFNRGISTSSVGGSLGPAMKFAGIDYIVLSGRAARLVYLLVEKGDAGPVARLVEAEMLWGKTTWETYLFLKRELGSDSLHVASIGPAGENLCHTANIIVDGVRSASWSGCGALMGSKRLKALVVKAAGVVSVSHPVEFLTEVRKLNKHLKTAQGARQLRRYGTLGVAGSGGLFGTGAVAVRNQQDEYWDPAKLLRLRETVFTERYGDRRLACFNCPLCCTHLYRIKGGQYGDLVCEGIHANHVRGFGYALDVDDPEVVLHAQALVSQLGLDVDSVSSTLAWAFECFEQGLLTESDTDGLRLEWGNGGVVLDLIRKIAVRTGIGELLADGVAMAAARLGRGSERYAMQCKGVGINEQGLRSNKAWALGILTSTRGGGHLNGSPNTENVRLAPEIGERLFGVREAGNPFAYEGKGRLAFFFERLKAMVDSLGMCYFTSLWEDESLLGPQDYARLYTMATGIEVDGQSMMESGERIYNIEKAFNTLHVGFTRNDDFPPARFMEMAISNGPMKGEKLTQEQWSQLLDEYYEVHGWDPVTGWQRRSVLSKLKLDYLLPVLEAAGRLP